jgi:hypothetical protein
MKGMGSTNQELDTKSPDTIPSNYNIPYNMQMNRSHKKPNYRNLQNIYNHKYIPFVQTRHSGTKARTPASPHLPFRCAPRESCAGVL